MQHTYTSSEHFQLGRRRNHAHPGQRKLSYPWRALNSRPSEYYMFIRRSNHWTGGSRVRFLPRAWKFPLSRASLVSPPSKLKMFTGSVCVLLTSVSLKVIKIKIKLIYAATSSWEKNKMAGESKVIPTDFIFLFIIRVVCFLHRCTRNFLPGGTVNHLPKKNVARCPNFYERVEKKWGRYCNNIGRRGIWRWLDTVLQGQYQVWA